MIDISDKVMQAIELLEMMAEEEAVAWMDSIATFDMASVLHSEEDIQNYLKLVAEDNDSIEVEHAQEVVAKARERIKQKSGML